MSAAADRSLRADDAEVRRRAVRTFDRPFVLEAGAGTGKTATLVGRIVRWCLDPGWRRHGSARGAESSAIAANVLERIAAITFTEKAAGEMAERLARAFDELAAGKSVVGVDLDGIGIADVVVRDRAAAFGEHMDRVSITTIHAWCRKVLSRCPLEAGLRPGFDIDADGRTLERTVFDVVSDWSANAYGAEADADALALLRGGITPARLVEAVTKLVASGVAPEACSEEPFPGAVVKERAGDIGERLASLCARIQGALLDAEKPKLKGDTPLAIEQMATLAKALRSAGTIEAVESIVQEDDAFGKALKRLDEWSKAKFTKGDGERLGDVLMRATTDAAKGLTSTLGLWRSIDSATMRSLGRVLAPLVERSRARLVRDGSATFDDLLRLTHRLLAKDDSIAARLRSEIDLLLVDEVQDTDPQQFEIVARLALEGPESSRPSLFVVGDPKQSIYGWRSADLAAYQDFIDRVRSEGGEIAGLCVNFRSVPAILDEVDSMMRPTMIESRGLQPPFQRLVPCEAKAADRGFEDGGRAPVEFWVPWARRGDRIRGKTPVDRAASIEATAIAADIRDLHDRHGVAWSDCAILFRSSTHQEVYLSALRDAGIPHLVDRDSGFYRRREVIEATSLVAAILDPLDHVSLVSWLRSPLVGIPDAAILPLWLAGLPEALSTFDAPSDEAIARCTRIVESAKGRLPDDVPGLDRLPDWAEGLRGALTTLLHLRAAAKYDPFDVFVEKLRSWTLHEGLESARWLGTHRVLNLRRFHRFLLDAMRRAEGAPQAVLRELREASSEGFDLAEAPDADESSPAVSVLTMHKAKGLDFRHVYLAELHTARAPGLGARRIADFKHARGRRTRMLFGMPDLDFDAVLERETEVERAERVRLLYVAATRARVRLVITGRFEDDPVPVPPSEAKSLLDLVVCRSRPIAPLGEFADEAGETGAAAERDTDGCRWVLLDPDLELGGQSESRDARSSVVFDLDGAARRREAAKRRAKRIRVGAPSKRSLGFEPGSPPEEEDDAPRVERDVAIIAGTLVHELLFDFDAAAEPRAEAARQESRLEAIAGSMASDASVVGAAVVHARDTWNRFVGSTLFERFASSRPRFVGREVPFLSKSRGDGEDEPTDAWSGAIDLLLEEDDGGGLLVVDYKTDRAPTAASREEHAARHRSQMSIYVEAVRLALGRPTRGEVWFVAEGEAVETHSRSTS